MKLRTLILTALMCALSVFASVSQASGWENHRKTISYAARYSPLTASQMAAVAEIESGFKTRATNRSGSSAAGLFQVTKGTWRSAVKTHGRKHGITFKTSRFNPRANALMTAELLSDGEEALRKVLGRKPTSGEVFLTHLLGTGGATKLFKAKGSAKAARLLPTAARGNKTFFYTKSGKARTVQQLRLYTDWKINQLAKKYDAPKTYRLAAR